MIIYYLLLFYIYRRAMQSLFGIWYDQAKKNSSFCYKSSHFVIERIENWRKKIEWRNEKMYALESLTWGQFHQHALFTCSFYARRSQKRKKTLMTWLSCLCFWDLYAYNLLVNMLVKSTTALSISISRSFLIHPSGVNFINVLRAAFTPANPECAKKTNNLTIFLRFSDLHG